MIIKVYVIKLQKLSKTMSMIQISPISIQKIYLRI